MTKRAFVLLASVFFLFTLSCPAHALTIPINWFDFATENNNIYEYIEGGGTSSPRLDTVAINASGYEGSLKGRVELGIDSTWDIQFSLYTDGDYWSESDWVDIVINGNQSRVTGTGVGETIEINNQIIGSAFDFEFNFESIYENNHQHMRISSATATAPVPEPSTMLLLATGLVGIAGIGRKKFRKQ